MPLIELDEVTENTRWVHDGILTFGKFKGMSLDDCIEQHPGYVLWAYNTINAFTLTDEQLELVEDAEYDEEEERSWRFGF